MPGMDTVQGKITYRLYRSVIQKSAMVGMLTPCIGVIALKHNVRNRYINASEYFPPGNSHI